MKKPLLDKRRAALRATIAELSSEPVMHPQFTDALEDLETAAESSSMPLLLGVAGAGKSYLCDFFVKRRCADPVRALSPPCVADEPPLPRLVAARVTAPASQRGAFSWKGLWKRSLRALSQPAVDSNYNPDRCAAALRAGKYRPGPRDTEADLSEKVRDAAFDRGLELLIVDEACSLTKFDRGRTLADQLDILRELADLTLFSHRARLVRSGLSSTCSVLASSTAGSCHIVFDRYLDASDVPGREDDYLNFCRVAVSLMERVPEWARLRLEGAEYRRLYNGSLGCVGVLSDWWRRALARCVRSGRALEWRDFEREAIGRDERAKMDRDAELASAYLKSRGTASLDTRPSDLPDPSPPPCVRLASTASQAKAFMRRPRRSRRLRNPGRDPPTTKSSDRLPGGRLRRPPKRLPVPTGDDSPPQDEE